MSRLRKREDDSGDETEVIEMMSSDDESNFGGTRELQMRLKFNKKAKAQMIQADPANPGPSGGNSNRDPALGPVAELSRAAASVATNVTRNQVGPPGSQDQLPQEQQLLLQLIQTQRAPNSADQQQQLAKILGSNPGLMTSFINHVQQQLQGQQAPHQQLQGQQAPHQQLQGQQAPLQQLQGQQAPHQQRYGHVEYSGPEQNLVPAVATGGQVQGQNLNQNQVSLGQAISKTSHVSTEVRGCSVHLNQQCQHHQPSRANLDPAKLRPVQQQLILILHAHKCQLRDDSQIPQLPPCSLPHCRTMKTVLLHMRTCLAVRNCPFTHCSSSRQIISHWKVCSKIDCSVCVPVTRPYRNQNLHPPVDHVSGPVPQSRPPPQSAILNVVNANSSQTGQTIGNLGSNSGVNQPQTLLGMTASPMQITKLWHPSVSSSDRSSCIFDIANAIFPVPHYDASFMRILFHNANKIERDFYETANTRSEYYNLVAEKVHKIQTEPQERRQISIL